MIYRSPYEDIYIPECNILSYLFPRTPACSKPLWIDAKCPGKSLSRADMLLWIKRFAVGLDNLGIGPDEAVMVFTHNHLYVPVIYLGASGSGRYYTGANPAYTTDELAYQMSIVNCAVLLVHPSLLATGMAAARKVGLSTTRIFLFSDEYIPEEQQDVQDWRSFLATEENAASWIWDELDGGEAKKKIATINFSSGTTGLPKGVCTTHHNLIANASQVVYGMYRGATVSGIKERWLAALPLYHAFSQLYTINVACRLEIPVYIMDKFVLSTFLANIERYQITTIQTVPPVLAMISKSPDTPKYNITSLKNVMVGAAQISLELQLNLMQKFGFFISRGWGMTETTCVGTKLPINTRYDHNSIGYLLPNTEAKIVDENNQEIERGPGELWVRGPQMMLGYWKNENATKDTYSDGGWLRTGDIVIVKDNLWWIVDRKKELIKVNGLQVAPAELEAILLQMESISDAAVVGILLDGRELPRAYVVLSPGERDDRTKEREVQEFVARKVAKHKRLQGGVAFKEKIPRLLSGKIMRSAVREWAKMDAKAWNKDHSRL
ncbi:uncharacterized protein A1O9_07109 [Exophiala aquamarina CBS 119918]|uniref:Acetyl-CoA synthetase-like protein n=1 Tax=Exophiala aquamarina CBS 119918 TaxID=1182545 RepID=A0A072P9Y4_9EURO|nr:uncharacterized protein A1O9_07109 [Exophiala aquamarina CBS 119918]KEF56919.1 hypothetical protein A1O9_07109 [Exophiala aquamarina CBS 119918]